MIPVKIAHDELLTPTTADSSEVDTNPVRTWSGTACKPIRD